MTAKKFLNTQMSLADAFSTLGIIQPANNVMDLSVVKMAYQKLAFQNHPDRNPNDKESVYNFHKISLAYAILKSYAEHGINLSENDYKKQSDMDIEELLRHPNRYDLSDLFFRLGPRRFFTFMRYVYKKSKHLSSQSASTGVDSDKNSSATKIRYLCSECNNYHERYASNSDEEHHNDGRYNPNPDEDQWTDDSDHAHDYEDYSDDQHSNDSELSDKEDGECEDCNSLRRSSVDHDLVCDSVDDDDDLETKFFKYMFEQSMADDYANFDGFWNKMQQSYAYEQETDSERRERIKRELEEKRQAEERRKFEKEEEKNKRMKEREQERKEAELRRQEKFLQKKQRREQSKKQYEEKVFENKKSNQELRFETFKEARSGNHMFVRDAVYKRGVAAEGLEVTYPEVVNCNGGIQIGSKSHQETLLHVAVRNDDVDLVDFLVSNGATPDECSSNGINSVHLCCILNRPSILNYFSENYQEFLLERTKQKFKSCKIDPFPTPLHLACERGFMRCVDILLRTSSCNHKKDFANIEDWLRKQAVINSIWESMLQLFLGSNKKQKWTQQYMLEKEKDFEAYFERIQQASSSSNSSRTSTPVGNLSTNTQDSNNSPSGKSKGTNSPGPQDNKVPKSKKISGPKKPLKVSQESLPPTIAPPTISTPTISHSPTIINVKGTPISETDDYIKQQEILLEKLSKEHKKQQKDKEVIDRVELKGKNYYTEAKVVDTLNKRNVLKPSPIKTDEGDHSGLNKEDSIYSGRNSNTSISSSTAIFTPVSSTPLPNMKMNPLTSSVFSGSSSNSSNGFGSSTMMLQNNGLGATSAPPCSSSSLFFDADSKEFDELVNQITSVSYRESLEDDHMSGESFYRSSKEVKVSSKLPPPPGFSESPLKQGFQSPVVEIGSMQKQMIEMNLSPNVGGSWTKKGNQSFFTNGLW